MVDNAISPPNPSNFGSESGSCLFCVQAVVGLQLAESGKRVSQLDWQIEHMAMYGRKASSLVHELKYCEDHRILPFKEEIFTGALEDIDEHHRLVEEGFRKMEEEGVDVQTTEGPDYVGGYIHHCSILRNKRCLLAYVYNRAERIRRLRWELGAVLPQDIQEKLSHSEKEFFKDYSTLLGTHMSNIDLDLTVDATPPKDPYVQVRVLENVGEVLVGDQSTSLIRNSIHFMTRTEAEPLVAQGLLEEVLE